MDTFFIRHKFNGAERDLCDASRIAINFQNFPVSGKQTEEDLEWFPNQAPAYKTALRYMIHLRDKGGYVFAEYRGGYLGKQRHKDIGCILAKITPQDRFESFRAPTNDYAYQVALKLDPNNLGFVRYADFPVLLAIRPPFSTICRPSRTYQQFAKAFFNREKIPGTDALENLHPKMVEQLCVEYLRQKGHENDKLEYCTLRPGKTLATIDIAGLLSSERRVFAQVKNAPLSRSVSERLANELKSFIGDLSEDGAVGILFAKFDDVQDHEGPIHFVNLDNVFQYFCNAPKKAILRDMVGFGAIETNDGSFPMDVDWGAV